MNQLIIPKFIFFFTLITYLVDIVLILLGEILSWSFMGIKGLIQIAKMKASFKNERKKEQQVLLPCIEFPGFKKITLESGIKSESLKRETAEQQLLVYISNERQ